MSPPITGSDFARFDQLVDALSRWSGSCPEWSPAVAVRREWDEVAPRLDRARRELTRVLVVGVVGGTGTGKSTLVNALAGGEVTEAGDVARPTTIAPVVVVARDVDVSWLPVEQLGARLVRSDSAAVANIVLVDCPDPDTQPAATPVASDRAARPSDANHNRDLLERVLPMCDVLLYVSTAQKYRSWIVAREVNAFAPGRPLLFVQTHAARDPDIRGDWQRELASQGFAVPRIFRVDGVEAMRRSAAGLEPEAGFRELVAAIDGELVGRAARRVRRTGAIDLAGWFVRQAGAHLAASHDAVAAYAAGVASERMRLEGLVGRSVEATLRGSRAAWQRRLADEVVDRWHGGPFAWFLHLCAACSGWWRRLRPGGGFVGRLLDERRDTAIVHDGWQAVGDLGLSEAEVEQSRSVLAGLAARAGVGDGLVGRVRLEPALVQSTAAALLDRAGQWLGGGIDRLVRERRGRYGGPGLHVVFELLFGGLVGLVLLRAGWNFFYGHLWLGRPVDGGGFLQEAIVWVVLWGLLLRFVVSAVVRFGLDRDIATLVGGLPAARIVDPLFADHAAAAARLATFLEDGRRLAAETGALTTELDEPAGLGRLRGPAA